MEKWWPCAKKEAHKNTKTKCGTYYEKQAEKFLKKQGFYTLQHQFNCRLGEVDLIMQNRKTQEILFVEVRYRRHDSYGCSADSINYSKQRRIIQAANIFLQRHPIHQDKAMRFDAITFDGPQAKLNWIQHAFQVE